MFEREMMISGLARQRNLLASLIQELESRPQIDSVTWTLCTDRTRQVANNLRKLRKIKAEYAACREQYQNG